MPSAETELAEKRAKETTTSGKRATFENLRRRRMGPRAFETL
jgi:hypothetical protein